MRRTILTLLVGLLTGAVVATTLAATTPAEAANGDPIYLGQANTAKSTTRISVNYGMVIRSFRAEVPAATFKVSSGAPIAVNSTGLVTDLNADLLDGYHLDNLRVKGTGCRSDDADDGTDFACDTNIYAPVPGLLLISGSIEVYNASAAAADMVSCGIQVDNVLLPSSARDMDVGVDADEDQAVCATDAYFGVDAGWHDIEFTLTSVGAETELGATGMTVIFIPGS